VQVLRSAEIDPCVPPSLDDSVLDADPVQRDCLTDQIENGFLHEPVVLLAAGPVEAGPQTLRTIRALEFQPSRSLRTVLSVSLILSRLKLALALTFTLQASVTRSAPNPGFTRWLERSSWIDMFPDSPTRNDQ